MQEAHSLFAVVAAVASVGHQGASSEKGLADAGVAGGWASNGRALQVHTGHHPLCPATCRKAPRGLFLVNKDRFGGCRRQFHL